MSSGIKVVFLGTEYSDYLFEITWPNGSSERYLINPFLGMKYKKQLKRAPGKVANLLKKHASKVVDYTKEGSMSTPAEKLITSYLEQDKRAPEATKFTKHLNKGQKVKADKILDLPFRDTDNNSDQDVTWRSSSTSPYR